VYHGEIIDIENQYAVVAPNIPMDALAFDWNQYDKQRIIKFHPLREKIINFTSSLTFWLGFIFSGFAFIMNPSTVNGGYTILYICVCAYSFLAPPERLWGRVFSRATHLGLGGLLLQLSHPTIRGVSLGKAKSAPDGKFFLKSAPGEYSLSLQESTAPQARILQVMNVKVGSASIVNSDFTI
jgi:hypothetical protein